jgi:predicted  nucleic acid-binding Zn-ribbon protein
MPLAFVAIGLAVVAFVLWLSAMGKSKNLSTRVASLLVENSALADEKRQAAEQQRKNQTVFDKRSEEVTELRKEIGALKKKNFTLQEEAKKSKTSFEAKIEEREKLLTGRPAFESAPVVEKPRPAAVVAAAPAPAPAPVAAPVSAPADSALLSRVEAMGRDNAELSAKVNELASVVREGTGEMRRMKKRIDDYRRADVVTKSKLDVLNDKLGTMGRRYYDAVSELAHLKGEVAPGKPELGIEASQASENPAAENTAAENTAADAPFTSEDEPSQAGRISH